MKTNLLRYTSIGLLSAVLLFWLLPPFSRFHYRTMKYFGERIERIPGPTKTTSE